MIWNVSAFSCFSETIFNLLYYHDFFISRPFQMLCVSAFALTKLLFSLSIRTDAFKHAYRSVSFPKETRVRDLSFSIESRH